MNLRSTIEDTNRLADTEATHLAAAGRQTARALDGLADDAQTLGEQVGPALRHAADQASDLTHDGLDALRSTGRHLLSRAHRASDFTAGYVRHEPLKAVLIALAGGALLMAAFGLLTRSRSHR